MGLEEIRKLKFEAGIPKQKKAYSIPKVSEKRKKALAIAAESGTDSGIDKFFATQRKKMVGKCLFCSHPTNKNDDEKFHFSIAHLLPKSIFKSVAVHESNWVELCFWGTNSCHTNFDNGNITWEFLRDSKEWDVIAEKLHEVMPMVSEDERGHKLYRRLTELLYDKKKI